MMIAVFLFSVLLGSFISGHVECVSKELLDKVQTLEAQGKHQAVQIERLENLVHGLQSVVKELTAHNQGTRSVWNGAELQDHDSVQNKHQKHLPEAAVKQHKDDEAELHKGFKVSTLSDHGMDDKTPEMEKGKGALGQLSTEEPVAFLAWMTNITSYTGRNLSVIFDYVVTNIGGGYNANNGLFVAPVSGLYVITASLEVQFNGPDYVYGDFVKNGKIFSALFSYYDGSQKQVSVTIVVHLASGDELGIIVGKDFGTIKLREKGASCFTGFLLMSM